MTVTREDNPNGAWAKSRRQRVVPLDFLTVQAFDTYQFERLTVPAAAGGDVVLVNLFRAPVVARAPAMVWDVRRSADSNVIGSLANRRTCVNHYSFHIRDSQWGHLTIKMAGHAPFAAHFILNGHEYVAMTAQSYIKGARVLRFVRAGLQPGR